MKWRSIGNEGFTMLEVLLAVVILSMISMTIWTTFSNSFKMRDKLDVMEENTHTQRALLQRLSRDCAAAFVVKDKKYNTLFQGKDEGSFDTLTFSTMSAAIFGDEIGKSEQQIVAYYTQSNRDDPALVDVYRWSYPYLEDDQYWGERHGVKILEGVRKFDLSYYDGQGYRTVWDTTQAELVGKLPEAVRLSLEVANKPPLEDSFILLHRGAIGAAQIKRANSASPTPGAGSATPTPGIAPTPNPNGQTPPNPTSFPNNDGDGA